jgi:hypothetical protein
MLTFYSQWRFSLPTENLILGSRIGHDNENGMGESMNFNGFGRTRSGYTATDL